MIPPAAIAAIAQALDTYRLLMPPDTQNPAEAAEYVAAVLPNAGWTIRPADETTQPHTPPPEDAR
ncbi:MAG TPA: hypothetical protein VFY14_12305 [Streptomyces sp.]|nr:hypothetical protein [Streptomyces sp.]